MSIEFNFATWLTKNEVSTSTGDVAGFARPMMDIVRRNSFGVWSTEDPFFYKKRKKRNNRYNESEGGDGGKVQKNSQECH